MSRLQKTALVACVSAFCGCTFDPSGWARNGAVDGGGDQDAPVADGAPGDAPLVVDAAPADAPGETSDASTPDASVPDATPPDAGPPDCPGAYTRLGNQGHAYLYVQSSKRWEEAEAECRAQGTHLLVMDAPTLGLNSQERMDVLGILPTNNFQRVWIGHTDRVEEGVFRSVVGSVVGNDTVSWLSHEPNDFLNGEDCVEMTVNRSTEPGRSGRLNDANCANFNSGYVCECDGQPEDPSAF